MKLGQPIVRIAAGLALASAVAFAQVPEGLSGYEVPGDATFPEGIAYHEQEGALYVGGAASGAIYRIDLATGEASTFAEPGSRPPFGTLGLALSERHLWVAGGNTGTVARYDLHDARIVDVFETPEASQTLINDVFVATDGTVYATDSFRPVLFRIEAGSDVMEPWLDLEGTAFEYGEGVNANGLVVTDDNAYLIVVALNSGALYRVDLSSQEVVAFDVEGGPFPGGDGLVLDGDTLYVAQQGADRIAVVELDVEAATASVVGEIASPEFAQIATLVKVGDDLVVVNTQFGAMQSADGPELPFQLSVVSTVD